MRSNPSAPSGHSTRRRIPWQSDDFAEEGAVRWFVKLVLGESCVIVLGFWRALSVTPKWLIELIEDRLLGVFLVVPTFVVFWFAFNNKINYAVFGIGNIILLLNIYGLSLAVIVPFISGEKRKIEPFFQPDGIFYFITTVLCKILRVPYGRGFEEIRLKILERYGKKTGDAVKDQNDAINYLEKEVDRILNKARGLLTFNSILMALNSFQNSRLQDMFKNNGFVLPKIYGVTEFEIIAGLSISSILLLEIFFVKWGDNMIYSDEYKEISIICRNRSIVLNSAIVLSIFCLTGLMVNNTAVMINNVTSFTI